MFLGGLLLVYASIVINDSPKVVPSLLLTNWAFRRFAETVIFFSVLLATILMSDGRSHWLKGYILMLAYTFIAASWQQGR